MADLVELNTLDTPRPPDVCKRYVRRIESLWGLVIYGVLWCFVAFAALWLGCELAILVGAAVGAKGALWVTVISCGAGATAFVLAWIPYERWVKRQRARTRSLIRDGEVVWGRVAERRSRVTVDHDGKPRVLHVSAFGGSASGGAPIPVLFHPDSKYALVFAKGGEAMVAHVRAPSAHV
jgi:hypothetical protein